MFNEYSNAEALIDPSTKVVFGPKSPANPGTAAQQNDDSQVHYGPPDVIAADLVRASWRGRAAPAEFGATEARETIRSAAFR